MVLAHNYLKSHFKVIEYLETFATMDPLKIYATIIAIIAIDFTKHL